MRFDLSGMVSTTTRLRRLIDPWRTCGVTAMLGANKRRRARYRHLRHRCHGGGDCVRLDEEVPMFTTTAMVSTIGIARWLKRRTDEIKTAKLVAFLSAMKGRVVV
jgi:hypothetical protein